MTTRNGLVTVDSPEAWPARASNIPPARAWLGALAMVLIFMPAAFGQGLVPAGDELQISSTSGWGHWFPSVAALDGGGFVTVWHSFAWPVEDIQGRIHGDGGMPLGEQFQINTLDTFFNGVPKVTALAGGGFVTVWMSDDSAGSDSDQTSIQARIYGAGGTPVGEQFQVNTYTSWVQISPDVAALPDGRFVVVWAGNYSGGSVPGVQAQIFDDDGRMLGGEFEVLSHRVGGRGGTRVAALAGGGFVAVWQSEGANGTDTSGWGIQGRIFTAGGEALGDQFQVNSYTTGGQRGPMVAGLADGGFAAAWASDGSNGADDSESSIQARRFDAGGAAHGPDFQVNSFTDDYQLGAAVAAEAGGGFIVSWFSWGSSGSDDSDYAVLGQRLDAAGKAVGGEFQVNTTAPGYQSYPAVTALDGGDFIVAWQNSGPSGAGVQGQRFATPRYALAGLAGKCLDVEAASAADGRRRSSERGQPFRPAIRP